MDKRAGFDDEFVDLRFRNGPATADSRLAVKWKGFSAERVVIVGVREFSYDWSGQNHYLALHDIKLTDGDISLAGSASVHRMDLRDRMTMAPGGCQVSGWSSLANRTNEFTAITFDPEMLVEEIDRAGWRNPAQPSLYFSDLSLASTMKKLRTALSDDDTGSVTYAETLALVAVLELGRLQSRNGLPDMPERGGLSAAQARLVRDYIADKLHTPLTLSEVANLTGLSRFHFARGFKNTFGLSPHAYILASRIDRAKGLLRDPCLPLASIASLAGFKRPDRFSAAFRKAVGCSPSRFRRAQLDE